MPNWCDNVIIVQGSRKAVKRFMEDVESEEELEIVLEEYEDD